MNEIWNRTDLVGKLSRRILQPPVVIQNFDKTQGVSLVQYKNLGPRLSLRLLASYKTIFLMFLAMFAGHIIFGSAGYGIFLLCLLFLLVNLLRSILNL